MTKKEQKISAQDLIMEQLATIGYGTQYEGYCDDFESVEEANECLKKQMDRIAKMFGYKESWFY